MDAAKQQQAIEACGHCGQPEEAHQHRTGTDRDDLEVFAALGGPCIQYVASDAAIIYAKHLAITNNRAPAPRKPGEPVGRRPPVCHRCGNRGHLKETCPF